MKRLVYLIGYPGAGKSSALGTALLNFEGRAKDRPVPHIRWVDGESGLECVELGRRRETFSGTDALGMAIQPRVLDWLPKARHRLLVAEGDRLGNASFFRAVEDLGVSLDVVLLDLDVAVAKARAAKRAVLLGTKPQDSRWWKGRVTKVDNLGALVTHTIDASRSGTEVALDLYHLVFGGGC